MNSDLVEHLRKFREKYESVVEVNNAYEKMFHQMKEYCKHLHTKFNNTVRSILNNKTYLESNISNLQRENETLKEQNNKLVAENGACAVSNAVLQNIIKGNEIKIFELEKQLRQLNSKLEELNFEHENTIAELQRCHEEEIKTIVMKNEDENRKRKILEAESNNNQVGETQQSKVTLEKQEYVERLKYLEKVHREECDHKDAEILRLQGLLKTKTKIPVKTKKPVKGVNGSRYPELSEFVQFGVEKSDPPGIKKRKLYNPDDDVSAVDLV